MSENPIDKDKITENPHNLPYAHTVGGFVIKPIDKGRIKGNALAAMEEQTDIQLKQIKEQIDLLAQQAQALVDRKEISYQIYGAEMGFKPVVGKTYHLYERDNGNRVLSLVGPNNWGKEIPFETFIATVRMLGDHTWEILEVSSEAK